MKAEYQEMLDKVVEMFLLYGLDYKEEEEFPLSEKEAKHRGDMFDKLIESGDPEVLHGLMGMLAMKVRGGGALDETFPEQIFNYYTHEQIMDAVFEKFDAIYDNDKGPDDEFGNAYILEDICDTLLLNDNFPEFRKRFNKIRPRNAERFLNIMERYYTPYNPKRETENDVICRAMIQTLREDMKQW